MRRLFMTAFLVLFASATTWAGIVLNSPDGKVSVEVNLTDKITYTTSYAGQTLMEGNELAMKLANGTVLGQQPKLKKKKVSAINETIRPLFPLKKATVENNCNVLTLTFKGDYSVQFRAYNNGVAYRFITNLKGNELIVEDETFTLGLKDSYLIHYQRNNSVQTSNEQPYQHKAPNEIKDEDGFINLPLLIDTKTNNLKIFFSEGGQWDYPGMFLKGNNSNQLHAFMPINPKSKNEGKEYIAKTSAARSFPWRYFVISKNDGELLECSMNACLAEPCKIEDTSWIKPGQVSWDWWNGWDVYGPDIAFKAGINTETYKYFIDFASKYKIPYIIMDDGWGARRDDPMKERDGLDLKELIRYGKEKNVGIILWLHWTAVVKHPEFFAYYEQIGIKGMKIDFMDRTDQEMVNFYENTTAEAAKHHLMVDYHGAYKPSGLEYVYPNILSHEGVRGMEQEGGCTPDNTLYEMFIRNVAGPMDYTPGAMLSYQPEVFHGTRPNNSSIGTRAYQMALYVVMESGIQMLSDTPTNYYRNPDCTDFIASVPVLWDDTRALDAVVGEYEVIAKRRGSKWFIGGVTNSKGKQTEITLDFLDSGKTYTMTSFEDGSNAARQAMHYVKNQRQVKKGDKIQINMVRNGGFAAVIQ